MCLLHTVSPHGLLTSLTVSAALQLSLAQECDPQCIVSQQGSLGGKRRPHSQACGVEAAEPHRAPDAASVKSLVMTGLKERLNWRSAASVLFLENGPGLQRFPVCWNLAKNVYDDPCNQVFLASLSHGPAGWPGFPDEGISVYVFKACLCVDWVVWCECRFLMCLLWREKWDCWCSQIWKDVNVAVNLSCSCVM